MKVAVELAEVKAAVIGAINEALERAAQDCEAFIAELRADFERIRGDGVDPSPISHQIGGVEKAVTRIRALKS